MPAPPPPSTPQLPGPGITSVTFLPQHLILQGTPPPTPLPGALRRAPSRRVEKGTGPTPAPAPAATANPLAGSPRPLAQPPAVPRALAPVTTGPAPAAGPAQRRTRARGRRVAVGAGPGAGRPGSRRRGRTAGGWGVGDGGGIYDSGGPGTTAGLSAGAGRREGGEGGKGEASTMEGGPAPRRSSAPDGGGHGMEEP